MSPKKVETTNRVSSNKKGEFRESVDSRKHVEAGRETAKNRGQKPVPPKPKKK